MAIDWTKIQRKYAGQWVAFKKDEKTVVAAAGTLKAVYDKAQSEGCARPIVSFMPTEDINFVG